MDFSFLEESVGKYVQAERNGPNKIGGILRAIKPDFLAIERENGEVLYVNSLHIKTLMETVITGVQMREELGDSDSSDRSEPTVPMIDADTFYDLLVHLKHRLIRINQGGEAVEGVLIEIRDDSVTLLHNMKDFVHFPTYHIKSLMVLHKPNEQGKQENDKKNDGKHDGKKG